MTRGQHARKHGVTMNTNIYRHTHGLITNVLYAVIRQEGELYALHGPGIVGDTCWVHADCLHFEGPPCMFNKEV